MTLTVLRTGPLTVVKDAGRPGHAHQGVAPTGAVDRGAYARANALAGNPAGAAVLECTLGGLRLRADEPVVVVLTGTDAVLDVDGARSGVEEVVEVPAGATVSVTMPRRGLRSYLAVRGGFAVPEVLGSRSTDQIGGIGPARLAKDDVLPVGPATAAPEPAAPPPATADPGEPLDVDLGPRDDWFTADAVQSLLSTRWAVGADSNRVGMRLEGPAMERAAAFAEAELPSEGVVRGSLQIAASGRPTLFLADHPVTGGYPVAAVVVDADTDALAQVRVGQHIRFRATRA
jgi:biotin-dependent carboxylase-like uncharacterized protein